MFRLQKIYYLTNLTLKSFHFGRESLLARYQSNDISHEKGGILRMKKKALAYCDNVKVHFDEIRYHADKLELIVEDELWPLPKFRELLFIR